MRTFQSSKQLCARALCTQQGNFGRALFNPPRQLWARPFAINKATNHHLYTSPGFPLPPPHSSRLLPPLLCAQLISPPSHIQASRDPHTPPPLLGMVASVCSLWPLCGHKEAIQAVRLKSGLSMALLQFLNLPGCGENSIRKFSCFIVRVEACCTGLPAGLPIKEIPVEPGLQCADSDGHHHTPRGHNLNYTIWTMYAESVSSYQCQTPLGARPFQSIRQLWVPPDQQGRALSNLSANFGRPRSTGARPFQSIRQLWARPDQRTLFNQQGNFGHALTNRASPFTIYQATLGAP